MSAATHYSPSFSESPGKRKWRSKRDGGSCASSAGLRTNPAGSQTTTHHHKQPSGELDTTEPVMPQPTRTNATIFQGVSPHDPAVNDEDLSEDGTLDHDIASGTELNWRGLFLLMSTDMVYLYAMQSCHLPRRDQA
ncbi:unnamed protein product [Phytophthora fragariaefolia]|uniref:Unnamed protein product n=1 Tax=Phytophthora fragariaefolia TaxID=1490495 RepID=A0A9W6TZN6_9STRA|nr:unnamed protein product [Phytophthora fragariaefolia]